MGSGASLGCGGSRARGAQEGEEGAQGPAASVRGASPSPVSCISLTGFQPTSAQPTPAPLGCSRGTLHKLTSVFFSKPKKTSGCQKETFPAFGLGGGAQREPSISLYQGEVTKHRAEIHPWGGKMGSSLPGSKKP